MDWSTVGARTAGGLLLVGIGAFLLLGQVTGAHGLGFSWPLFVVMPGVLLLVVALFGDDVSSPLAVPGSVVTAVGLILLWQAGTGYYESWAYAWLLLPAAAGAGLALRGMASGQESVVRTGVTASSTSLAAFVVAWPLYELAIKRIAPMTALSWPQWGIAWPYYIIFAGLLLFAAMLAGGRGAAVLAIPASVVTVVGLILLYQDATLAYLSWTYAWALIPAAVGLGMMAQGLWSHERRTVRVGLRVAGISAIGFLLFATFFDVVLGFSVFDTGAAGKALWPALLVIAGAVALARTLISGNGVRSGT